MIRALGRLLPAVAAGAAFAGAAAAQTSFPAQFVHDAKLAAEANPPPQTRIYHGDIAAEGAWPWQVALLSRGRDSVFERQFCGGSLITRSWVLTAAHCVYQTGSNGKEELLLPGAVQILAGTNLLMEGQGEIMRVKAIHPHPKYDPVTIDNDIALLELMQPVSVATARPVALPAEGFEATIAPEGTTAVVTGWGTLENGGFPIDLRQASITVMDTSACNTALVAERATSSKADFDTLANQLGVPQDVAAAAWDTLVRGAEVRMTDNMVCSGYTDRPRGSCKGDSGGPLVVQMPDGNFIQIGIVSWGDIQENDVGCETEGHFAAYTRVENYQKWITSVVFPNQSRQ